ncbi:MAG: type II secretion system protein, partial [Phycisphaerales bacterium]
RGRHTRPRRRPQAARPVAEPKRSLCHPRPLHGFTLVELLVVVSIIALLIAILLPSLNKARESSKSLACLSHEHQIGLGLTGYQTDNSGYYPRIYGGGGTAADTWLYAIWTYVGYSSQSYTSSHGVQMWSVRTDANDVFFCPVTRVLREATPSPAGCMPSAAMYCYGMNGSPGEWTAYLAGVSNPFNQSLQLPQRPDRVVQQPSGTDAIIDCTVYGTGYMWNNPAWSPQPSGLGAPGGVIPHMGGANALYHDMHGKWLSDAEMPAWGALNNAPVFWKGQ